MAGKHGLPVTPHSANLGLVTLFTMHLLPALSKAGKYLEFSIDEADYYPWQYGLFRNDPYRVEKGLVTISEEPGWGVEIEPEWLARSQYQITELP
jgi:L-alanine-DL-glutamate epimerase-like enolase superfamily enzyme